MMMTVVLLRISLKKHWLIASVHLNQKSLFDQTVTQYTIYVAIYDVCISCMTIPYMYDYECIYVASYYTYYFYPVYHTSLVIAIVVTVSIFLLQYRILLSIIFSASAYDVCFPMLPWVRVSMVNKLSMVHRHKINISSNSFGASFVELGFLHG